MGKQIILFSKFSKIGLIISLLITSSLVGVTIYRGGFNLGIDFQSGQSIDVLLENTVSTTEIKEILTTDFKQVLVTEVGNSTNNSYNIKLSSSIEKQEQDLAQLVSLLEKNYGNVEVQTTSFIGSSISQNLFRSVVVLMIGALSLILLYIWLRFKIQFAISAILSLIHDAFFIVGVVGAFQFEVTISTVAAILTIIGYSLNDTIVIFDRIRENIVLVREGNFTHITDKSLTQTLSRTIITSLTTGLAILALMFFATGDVFNFARTLMIGVLEGTWSSLFIATPILSLFNPSKILYLFRKKQGSGVQYKVKSDDDNTLNNDAPSKKTISIDKTSSITNLEVEKIKAEVLAKQQQKRKKHH